MNIINSLIQNTINGFCEETLIEWYNLIERYIDVVKYKLRNNEGISWMQISQMPLSENFIRTFQDRVNWSCISGNLPLNQELKIEFIGTILDMAFFMKISFDSIMIKLIGN
jgi:hypothetical protein